ncbi:MAG: HepT-like ribonuclease domain-containing protein [Thermoanaerobaculia bacterium]
MQDRDPVYLGHMLDTAQQAVERVRAIERSDFDRDEDLRLALAHRIQIIGEAARRVSTETQRQLSAIPWAEIIGMRHKVIHDYGNSVTGYLFGRRRLGGLAAS